MPAAAVIPAPIAYTKVAAVKKLVVENLPALYEFAMNFYRAGIIGTLTGAESYLEKI